MTVAFRNVDVDAAAPVTDWPYEAIVTVIERGTLDDWLMLTREFDRDPWGPVSRQVEEFLAYEAPYGVAPLLERAIARARAQARPANERASPPRSRHSSRPPGCRWPTSPAGSARREAVCRRIAQEPSRPPPPSSYGSGRRSTGSRESGRHAWTAHCEGTRPPPHRVAGTVLSRVPRPRAIGP